MLVGFFVGIVYVVLFDVAVCGVLWVYVVMQGKIGKEED